MIFVGIDGGGTKTSLLAATMPASERAALSGAAINPQRVGLQQCIDTLTEMLSAARRQFDAAAPMRVYAGLAGAGRPDEQRFIATALLENLGGDVEIVVTHDADIALDAAFGEDEGTIIIAGTGSVVLARDGSNQRLQVGGWGYLLGDEGSGTVLGLEAVRAVCRALDGGPYTTLVQRLREEHGFADRDLIISSVYRQQWPPQRAARLVLEAAASGDAVAVDILREQTRALSRQVVWLARRHPHLPPRYVLWGGLGNEPVYRSAFVNALASFLPTWKAAEPICSPTEAALRRAFALDGSASTQKSSA